MTTAFREKFVSFVKNRWGNAKTALTAAFRSHILLIAIILSYTAACIITASIYNTTDKLTLLLYSIPLLKMIWFFFAFVFLGRAAYILLFVRPQRLTRSILNSWRENYVNSRWLCNALPILVFLPIFMSSFGSFKTMLPVVNPFCWDAAFARWDCVIHCGREPWQLLQPFFGRPILTSTLNFFYNIWFFLMFGVLLWQAFNLANPRLRMQFFLTFVLCWILIGTVAATLLSSAGPCYYGRLVDGPDVFKPLMDYLHSAAQSFPVWAIKTQETLWKSYQGFDTGNVNGISAMPSMHISIVILFAILGWRTNRSLGIIFTVYAVIIFLGSIHLAWHYAIDGYVAIAMTIPIWLFSGKLVNRFSPPA